LRDPALSVRFFGDLVRLPDHNICDLEVIQQNTNLRPRFPHSSVITLAAKAFHHHPFPVARTESRYRFSEMAVSPLPPLEDCSSVESNTTLHQREC
jgi:hypothetical protein